MFLLAHLSDLHATRPEPAGVGELFGKRGLSWLSWRTRRRESGRAQVLEAVLRDLESYAPTHVAVTGDLTHLGLAGELVQAESWLRRIGPPERVSVVPGNHDALVGPAGIRTGLWKEYTGSRHAVECGHLAGPSELPALRTAGPVVFVGLSSARPTPPLLATGKLGATQLAGLEAALRSLGEAGWIRVVLVHHPPTPGGSPRRRLTDAAALRRILAQTGAELVLHGHTHRAVFATVPGPQGPIPVVGAPSASAPAPHDPARRAGYHLFSIQRRQGPRRPPAIHVTTRTVDPGSGRFQAAWRAL